MERRAHRRIDLVKSVSGRVPAFPLEITVLDIASSGCRIEARTNLLSIGSEVSLHLDDKIDVKGHVVWKDKQYYGIKFDRRLGLSAFASIATPKNTKQETALHFKDGFGRSMPPLRFDRRRERG